MILYIKIFFFAAFFTNTILLADQNIGLMPEGQLIAKRDYLSDLLRPCLKMIEIFSQLGLEAQANEMKQRIEDGAIELGKIESELLKRARDKNWYPVLDNTNNTHMSRLQKNLLIVFGVGVASLVSYCIVNAVSYGLDQLCQPFKKNCTENKNFTVKMKIKSNFIGQDSLKKKIIDIIHTSLDQENATGILLYGPPGTGKSELAKYVAEAMNMPYKVLLASDIMGMYVGESENKLKNIMNDAIASIQSTGKPCILIIDECEILFGQRGGGSRPEENIKNMLLQYFEGFYSTPGLIILGITNLYDNIDKAFLRPGRFTHKFKMDMPSLEDKKKIFDYYKEKYKVCLSPEITVSEIEYVLKNLSPAQITYFFYYYKNTVMTKEMMNDRFHELREKQE
jgi:ATP-dependent Zn protease